MLKKFIRGVVDDYLGFHKSAKELELEKRIVELENTVFALKENVKEQKQKNDVEKKQKWLRGFPDESQERVK
jgi:hypothetical protein